MAPKKNAAAAASSATTPTSQTATPAAPTQSSSANIRNAQDLQEIVQGVWNNYLRTTPQRVKLLDVFLGFLVLVAAIQFVYCVIVGNFPFNAFLSGFSATVGQFVLTVSLRMQTNPQNRAEFKSISDERAFADYIFGSIILHFFCVNFIN